MRPYSTDLRLKIVAAYDAGGTSQAELARRFSVSRSFVEQLLRRRRSGKLSPRPRGGGRSRLLGGESLRLVEELVRSRAEITLRELCEAVAAEAGVRVSVPTMSRAVRRLDVLPAADTSAGGSPRTARAKNSKSPAVVRGVGLSPASDGAAVTGAVAPQA